MFRRLDESSPVSIEIFLDGDPLRVSAGISLAAALFEADALPTRHTAVRAAPRGAFCMMGACFDCLVEIDGGSSQRACQIEVYAGMRIRRHRGLHEDTGSKG